MKIYKFIIILLFLTGCSANRPGKSREVTIHDAAVLQDNVDYIRRNIDIKEQEDKKIYESIDVQAYMLFSDCDPHVIVNVKNTGYNNAYIYRVILYCNEQQSGVKVFKTEDFEFLKLKPDQIEKDVVGYFESPYSRPQLANLICHNESKVTVETTAGNKFSDTVEIRKK